MYKLDELEKRLKSALSLVKGGEGEIAAVSVNRRIFRLANNGITQSTDGGEGTAWVRCANAKKQGFAHIPSLAKEPLNEGVKAAMELRDLSPPLALAPQFSPQPREIPTTGKTYFESVSQFTPEKITSELERVFRHCRSKNITLAGLYLIAEFDFVVLNTLGLCRHFKGTKASFKAVTYGDDEASGYAHSASRDPERVKIADTATYAVSECERSKNPLSVEPGKYDVLLMPPAISEVLEWMSFTAFNSRSVAEKTGFLADAEGNPITGENITIYDDGNESSEDAYITPFDFEGVTKRKVVFIENGVAGAPVFSLNSGKKSGCQSTGHALPPGLWDIEDAPTNIYISPGDKTLDEMIQSVERGIFIPRFHYVNGYLNPKRALMTGLTREGAFLIEKGKKTRAIKQLRWTEAIIDALKRAEALGNRRECGSADGDLFGQIIVPPILIRDFNFSGSSKDMD